MAITDQEFHTESLTFAASQIERFEAELAQAKRSRRIAAVLAHRGGVPKTTIAELLGVSRPTLDAWIAQVEATPEEIASVEQTEYVARRVDDKRSRGKATS